MTHSSPPVGAMAWPCPPINTGLQPGAPAVSNPETVSTVSLLTLPPLEGELLFILGRPCFSVAPIARRLHDLGIYQVERKAEHEQAIALYWMLNLYLTHGDNWRQEAERILKGN